MTGADGYLTASYRYNAYGEMTFGKPQYENVYGYNGESYNPNLDGQYLRARYYHVETANFFTEDNYLGDIREPLSLNRYNYVYSSYLNYVDPSGMMAVEKLKVFLGMYSAGQLTAEDLSTLVIGANGGNIYNAFHEIAQIHAANSIFENEHPEMKAMGLLPQSAGIWLEKSVKAAEKIGEKTIDKCYEADISYQRVPANTMMLWEVKPTTYLAKRWLYNKTNEKYEKMLFDDLLKKSKKLVGDNSLINYMNDIPVTKGLFSNALGLPEIYMNVFPSSFNEGIVYYSLYMKKKRPGYEFEKVYVSNAEAKKAINEKNKELGRVAAATILGGLGMNTAYAIEGALGVGQLPDSVMLPQGVF